MENQDNPDLEKTKIDLPEYTKQLEEKALEAINPSKMKEMVSDLKVNEVVGDLFYESVKLFFDIGFDLADKLNLDLIQDFLKKDKETD
ncbi:MAG: hypothetical protein EU535_00080 [Promethearchaeota archaeon]|nr:MAG: hypothetical protein EU535_00080 [Candidatus Lokiarchaeota archaeon]